LKIDFSSGNYFNSFRETTSYSYGGAENTARQFWSKTSKT